VAGWQSFLLYHHHLIADISKIPPGWVVLKRFLSGLGRPWEPDPWEYSTAEEDELLIEASQRFEELKVLLS